MPQLDQRLVQLAERRPPVGADVLIHRIEMRMPDVGIRRASPALHPARAMVLAATAMFVFVGGVAVGHWAFGNVGSFDAAFGGAGSRTTTADISVLALVATGASAGTVLLFGALGLAWRWRQRRRTYLSSIDQGGIMETIARTTPKSDPAERVLRINRWIVVGLVLALAALAGLGAWLLIDNFVTSDVEALVRESNAALNAGDDDAYVALHSPDVVFTTVIDGELTTAYESEVGLRVWLGGLFDTWHTEITGEVVVDGDYATFPNTVGWTTPEGVEGGYEGVHVVRFEDGVVAEHLFMGRSAPGF